MEAASHKIEVKPAAIRLLPEALINQIAAGEVVARPASVVKELLENALDAEAHNIDILIENGGRSLIQVTDDGIGIGKGVLPLALKRHATSKLVGEDLLDIRFMGFRGEALPSIAAVSRFSISSRISGEEHGWVLRIEGGVEYEQEPVARACGTSVEVRDLFFATPARLKFLKSDRAEMAAISEAVKMLAMSHGSVTFNMRSQNRRLLHYEALPMNEAAPDANQQASRKCLHLPRVAKILGREFAENAYPIEAEREQISLTGFVAPPTLHKATATHIFLFVNGRPVRDRLLTGAVRAAFADMLPKGRHPMAALNIGISPRRVDVNVHPTKAEVRFREARLVRSLLIGGITHALTQIGRNVSTLLGTATIEQLQESKKFSSANRGPYPAPQKQFSETAPALDIGGWSSREATEQQIENSIDEETNKLPLGVARAQFHKTYIISQTKKGLVIVDQHAAHERLVYEEMRLAAKTPPVASQTLLIPEIVEIEGEKAALLLVQSQKLSELGLDIEPFGEGALCVRALPAILSKPDISELIEDIADTIFDSGDSFVLEERIDDICRSMACHNSIRSGHRMSIEEMNALLRKMENSPRSGQCNHGRPTHINLTLADLEKLFERG